MRHKQRRQSEITKHMRHMVPLLVAARCGAYGTLAVVPIERDGGWYVVQVAGVLIEGTETPPPFIEVERRRMWYITGPQCWGMGYTPGMLTLHGLRPANYTRKSARMETPKRDGNVSWHGITCHQWRLPRLHWEQYQSYHREVVNSYLVIQRLIAVREKHERRRN